MSSSKLEEIANQDTIAVAGNIAFSDTDMHSADPDSPIPYQSEMKDTVAQIISNIHMQMYEVAAEISIASRRYNDVIKQYRQEGKKSETPLRLYTAAVLRKAEKNKDVDIYVDVALQTGKRMQAALFAKENGCFTTAMQVLEDGEMYLEAADIARESKLPEEELALLHKYADRLKKKDRKGLAEIATKFLKDAESEEVAEWSDSNRERFPDSGKYLRAMVLFEHLDRPMDLWRAAKTAERINRPEIAKRLYQNFVDKFESSDAADCVCNAADACAGILAQPERAYTLYTLTIDLMEGLKRHKPLEKTYIPYAAKVADKAAEICNKVLNQPERSKILYRRTLDLLETIPNIDKELLGIGLQVAKKIGDEALIAVYKSRLGTDVVDEIPDMTDDAVPVGMLDEVQGYLTGKRNIGRRARDKLAEAWVSARNYLKGEVK